MCTAVAFTDWQAELKIQLHSAPSLPINHYFNVQFSSLMQQQEKWTRTKTYLFLTAVVAKLRAWAVSWFYAACLSCTEILYPVSCTQFHLSALPPGWRSKRIIPSNWHFPYEMCSMEEKHLKKITFVIIFQIFTINCHWHTTVSMQNPLFSCLKVLSYLNLQ